MKILVTGGAGYIGSVLVPELLKAGHKVRVLDSLIYNQNPLLLHFIDENFEFIKDDIRNVEAVKKAVAGVDVIIHLAAIVGAPACKRDPKLAEEVNYTGTVNIVNACTDSQKFFFASTGSVYGKVEGICTEDIPTNPLSEYGDTKLRAEQAVMQAGNAIAYRFATAFGLAPRLRLDLLPNDFVAKALREKYLLIYDKDFKRTFVHVRDIVRAYIFGIEHFDAMKNEVYNVGSEKMNRTKEEIANLVRERIPFEIEYAEKGIPDPDQRDYEVSYQKIARHGFDTEISLEKGIQELIDGLNALPEQGRFSNV
ncbi:epimerase [Candidatus Kaiserbacteria bacterium RIFCSPLOWO2_01_FULL_53_17]|uniref:Epimerase n=1 Tax=Candidatus Kaiserbacteria bacterium RIFCSPLOWO2_01_FULL_53_17 TaxID=1798511 RepID=A0A1F6EG81_9BACT|nr:MAG: epimerase [Candidatus Kaiserbacteria bacterium RIFCSPLOWO2_01_FULL_53_17]